MPLRYIFIDKFFALRSISHRFRQTGYGQHYEEQWQNICCNGCVCYDSCCSHFISHKNWYESVKKRKDFL